MWRSGIPQATVLSMTNEVAESLRVGDRVFATYGIQHVEAGIYTKHDLRVHEMTVLSKHRNETSVEDVDGRKYDIFNEKLHIERKSATQMIEIVLEQLLTDMTKNHKSDIDRLTTFAETVREELYRSARGRLAGTRT